jgi:hypothetical protein
MALSGYTRPDGNRRLITFEQGVRTLEEHQPPRPGSFPLWDGGYCLVLGTPLPFRVQNIENKGFTFRLCARSLSLQELRAKSRQHRSYGGYIPGLAPFWN